MSGFKICQAWGVGDVDWFRVLYAHDCRNGDRVWIERVIAFAVEWAEQSVNHVTPVMSDGMPCTATEDQTMFADTYIVKGGDLSPTGECWETVHANATPSAMNVREITTPMLAAEASAKFGSAKEGGG